MIDIKVEVNYNGNVGLETQKTKYQLNELLEKIINDENYFDDVESVNIKRVFTAEGQIN